MERDKYSLTATLEKLYNFDADLLQKTLRIIVDSWRGQPDSFLPEIVEGVALYLIDHYPVDPLELTEALAALRCGPLGLVNAAMAAQKETLATAVAKQIAAIHR